VIGARATQRALAHRRGFTLLELIVSFAIIAIVVVTCMEVQTKAIDKGAKARDLREMRVMADTVFRQIVYEHWKWQDGMRGTADEWYAPFAGITDTSMRDRWRIYRLELHKTKGMVAGTDPSGHTMSLFDDGSGTTTTTNTPASPSSSSSSSSSSPSSTSGAGSDDATSVGEPAYQLELNVFLYDSEEPELTLRSVIPVPDSEREEESK
jgi:prepilin-type N-terminal cleavage/methylation domain-containing protein